MLANTSSKSCLKWAKDHELKRFISYNSRSRLQPKTKWITLRKRDESCNKTNTKEKGPSGHPQTLSKSIQSPFFFLSLSFFSSCLSKTNQKNPSPRLLFYLSSNSQNLGEKQVKQTRSFLSAFGPQENDLALLFSTGNCPLLLLFSSPARANLRKLTLLPFPTLQLNLSFSLLLHRRWPAFLPFAWV